MKKLIVAGVQVVFSDAGCKMVKGAMVIAIGFKYGKMYKIDAYAVECNSTSMKRKFVATSLEEVRVSFSADGHGFWVTKGALSSESNLSTYKTMLWHQRLGHIREKGLRTLKTKKP